MNFVNNTTKHVYNSSNMKKRVYHSLNNVDCNEDLSEFDTVPPTQIHNIVSTTQIKTDGDGIDLELINLMLPYSHYDKSRFAAITIRINNPCCTALLFTSGKLVITGAVSWYECVLAAREITKILQKTIVTQRFWYVCCDIQNIVARVCLPLRGDQKLDIDSMYEKMNNLCTFQKNMFPGLVFRPIHSPVVLLCFQSGKIVVTGGKTVEDVEMGWRVLWPKVKQFIVDK